MAQMGFFDLSDRYASLDTIGMVHARSKIGIKNLAYNMRRLGQLRRINPCPA